jgi:hypothetical protein
MRIFGFDLLPYPEHLDHLKVDGELPYPLPAKHFRPELAVRNYREHLDAWALMDPTTSCSSIRAPCPTTCS